MNKRQSNMTPAGFVYRTRVYVECLQGCFNVIQKTNCTAVSPKEITRDFVFPVFFEDRNTRFLSKKIEVRQRR